MQLQLQTDLIKLHWLTKLIQGELIELVGHTYASFVLWVGGWKQWRNDNWSSFDEAREQVRGFLSPIRSDLPKGAIVEIQYWLNYYIQW